MWSTIIFFFFSVPGARWGRPRHFTTALASLEASATESVQPRLLSRRGSCTFLCGKPERARKLSACLPLAVVCVQPCVSECASGARAVLSRPSQADRFPFPSIASSPEVGFWQWSLVPPFCRLGDLVAARGWLVVPPAKPQEAMALGGGGGCPAVGKPSAFRVPCQRAPAGMGRAPAPWGGVMQGFFLLFSFSFPVEATVFCLLGGCCPSPAHPHSLSPAIPESSSELTFSCRLGTVQLHLKEPSRRRCVLHCTANVSVASLLSVPVRGYNRYALGGGRRRHLQRDAGSH